MAKTPMGRHSIFRGKDDGYRVQAIITKIGGQRFERARKDLEKLYKQVVGVAPSSVSDADVVEYLSRGMIETRVYLMDKQK